MFFFMKTNTLILICLLVTISSISFSEIRLPAIISDHMVLRHRAILNYGDGVSPGKRLQLKLVGILLFIKPMVTAVPNGI